MKRESEGGDERGRELRRQNKSRKGSETYRKKN